MMKDTDPMPWGKYAGQPIGELPFKYLMWLYKERWMDGDVMKYFEAQLRTLEQHEEETAPLKGKKPKKYIIPDYECAYEQSLFSDPNDIINL